MASFEFCVYYSIWFLASLVMANEDVVSVNKPIVKSVKSWHFSAEYVRCFCNLPSCILTGYMCKSSGGGCFSDVIVPGNDDKGRHGCLEFLEEKYRCHGKSGINERTTIRRKENSKSHLMCCHHDMCNHIESPQTLNIINNTLLDDQSAEETEIKYPQRQEPVLYSDSEVWFRAATIAVPICGAVILFVLIALAVKILKSEHQNSVINKLGPAYYVQPIQQKNAKDKCNQENFHLTYDNLLRKDYIAPPHHNFFCAHAEEYKGQFREPLIQSECSTSEDKNINHTRYNLVNYEDSGKSIILEIEKENVPRS
ncbi:uncharacterized protein LOC126887198 [Diabrotica virgifera virgifera]|uniref:Uncharacterized protein LOC114343077 n=1 Tax=Diabrotica virgifera virgifera TaxID=50390 RepID=A0A6P7GJ53_DIAVI|nr:uncharacterized protein LOC126887198 [Diabrotica virgifera virgifera]